MKIWRVELFDKNEIHRGFRYLGTEREAKEVMKAQAAKKGRSTLQKLDIKINGGAMLEALNLYGGHAETWQEEEGKDSE